MKIKGLLLKVKKSFRQQRRFIGLVSLFLTLLGLSWSLRQTALIRNQLDIAQGNKSYLEDELVKVGERLEELKNQDQYQINQELQEEISQIKETYNETVETYEDMIEVQDMGAKSSDDLNKDFAQVLTYLGEINYASASAQLSKLKTDIKSARQKTLAMIKKESVQVSNQPPGSGYRRQVVESSVGSFVVDIVSADLNSTKVVVDTASDSSCQNDCPVLPLSTYIARSNAFAGVNGSYFCPASYPSCQNKKNAFDTLLMNKNKVYFNSDNNVYSTVPAVIFSGSSARFVSRSLDWGRDTSVDAVLANQPLLVQGGKVVFGGDGDPKKGSKSNRSFVGATGTTVYIGVVRNVTVAESAHVLKALGVEKALNLDAGGSTALWANGAYRAGPGRNLPNVLLLVRR